MLPLLMLPLLFSSCCFEGSISSSCCVLCGSCYHLSSKQGARSNINGEPQLAIHPSMGKWDMSSYYVHGGAVSTHKSHECELAGKINESRQVGSALTANCSGFHFFVKSNEGRGWLCIPEDGRSIKKQVAVHTWTGMKIPLLSCCRSNSTNPSPRVRMGNLCRSVVFLVYVRCFKALSEECERPKREANG